MKRYPFYLNDVQITSFEGFKRAVHAMQFSIGCDLCIRCVGGDKFIVTCILYRNDIPRPCQDGYYMLFSVTIQELKNTYNLIQDNIRQ